MTRARRWLRLLLWLPVPLLLYWALRDFRLEDTLALLASLAGFPLAALIAINLLFLVVLAARWGLILRALGASISLPLLGWYRLGGFAVSYLTPGPQFGGEPVQLALANRGSNLSYRIGSASLILDKSFELASNLTFLALGVWAILATGGLHHVELGMGSVAGRWALVLVPVLLLALPVTYLVASFSGRRPLSWLLAHAVPAFRRGERGARFAQAVATVEAQVSGFGRRRGRSLGFALGFFALVWGISLAEMWLALSFLGVQARLYELLVLMAGSRFAFLLPFPGALGALEATELSLFGLLGFPAEAAWAFLVYLRARDLGLAAVGLLAVAVGAGRRLTRRTALQAASGGVPAGEPGFAEPGSGEPDGASGGGTAEVFEERR